MHLADDYLERDIKQEPCDKKPADYQNLKKYKQGNGTHYGGREQHDHDIEKYQPHKYEQLADADAQGAFHKGGTSKAMQATRDPVTKGPKQNADKIQDQLAEPVQSQHASQVDHNSEKHQPHEQHAAADARGAAPQGDRARLCRQGT